MKNRIITSLYRVKFNVKNTLFLTMVTVASMTKTVFADTDTAAGSSGAVWDNFSGGAEGIITEFATVYTNKVWLIPLGLAIFKYFTSSEDKIKRIALCAGVGAIILFIACKVPVSTWQATGERIASLFNFG